MIVYTKTCLPCTHAQEWRDLRRFARTHSIEIEQRRTTQNPEWEKTAEFVSPVPLPFVMLDDTDSTIVKLPDDVDKLAISLEEFVNNYVEGQS